MLHTVKSAVAGLALMAFVAMPADAAGLPDFVPLAKSAGKAVVNINTEKKVKAGGNSGMPPEVFRNLPPGFERFFEQMDPRAGRGGQPRMQRSLGTGFIISADGYIVTNNHVVAGADVVRVNLEGTTGKEQAIPARIIGTDEETDLALLKVESKNALPFLEFGDSDKSEVGEWLLAIGNPFGLGHTVTQGILSAKGRDIQAGPYDNFLQTDASINPGNSGGPLIDMNGKVVGINTAIIASGQGIGFAIPSSMAQRIVEQLKTDKKVSRGWLGVGIQEVDANTAKALGLKKAEGVLISSVMDNEPAAKAGMQTGDVVLSINGEKVSDPSTLLRSVASQKPGAKVKVIVMRNGSEKELTIELGQRGDKSAEAEGATDAKQSAPSLGLSVRPLTAEEAASAGLKGGQGLLVVGVAPGKAAAEAELNQGDIILTANLKPLRTVKDFTGILASDAKERGAVILQVQRRGQVFFRTLPLEAQDK